MKAQRNIRKSFAAFFFFGVFLFGCSHLCRNEPVQEAPAQSVIHFDWRSKWRICQTNEIWSVDVFSDGRIEYSKSFPEQYMAKQKINQDIVVRMLSEIRHAGYWEIEQRELDAYIDELGITTNDATTTTLRIVWRRKPHTVCYEAMVVLDPNVTDINYKHIKALNNTICIVQKYTGLNFR